MRIGNLSVAAYWISVVLGALTLVLVVVNYALQSNNQSIQAEVNQRQQFINQSNQLSRVSDVLIRTIAMAAANAKDDKLRDMLAQQGITMTVTPGQSASPPGPGAQSVLAAPGAASDRKAP